MAPLTQARSGRLRTPRKYFALRSAARRIARSGRVQVVHAHYLLPMGVVARGVARAAGLPYVVTAHGTDVRNAESSAAVRARTEPVVRDAALVIAVSQQLAQRLRALYPGIAVAVVDMGVDTDVFAPPALDASPVGGHHVVAVGNLLPNKNHSRLIDAVGSLPETRLTIVGDGPLRDELHAQVIGAGLAQRVTLAGRLPRAGVADLLRTAEVATLVSIDEGYGLAALEAAACGCQVVVGANLPVAGDLDDVATRVDPLDAGHLASALAGALAAGRRSSTQARASVSGRSVCDRAREVGDVLVSVTSAAISGMSTGDE